MIVLDVNVLIYAHNDQADLHDVDRRWLIQAAAGPRPLALPLATTLGFLRIVTNPRALSPPLDVPTAHAILARLRAAPAVVEITPAEGHWTRMADQAADSQLRGPELTDVHLATLALERGAALATHDRGFRRFPGLEVIEPGV